MLLESVNATEVSEDQFNAAAKRLSGLTWLSNEQKLQFYALYKQSTVGDVNTAQPWSINMVAKAKWSHYFHKFIIFTCDRDAWKGYEGFPQKSAAMAYCFLVEQLPDQPIDAKAPSSSSNNAEERGMGMAVSTFADPLQ